MNDDTSVWLVCYDVDDEKASLAPCSKATIYNRVRQAWMSVGFTMCQRSVCQLTRLDGAEDKIRQAVELLESQGLRRYLRSMILKSPDGTDFDILAVLDKRAEESEKAGRILANILQK